MPSSRTFVPGAIALLLLTAPLPRGVLPAAGATAEPCRDPWISRAVREVAGRPARGQAYGGECDLELYGGRWASYAELRAQVAAAFRALARAGLAYAADGEALADLRFGGPAIPLERAYVGPAAKAPARNWRIPLTRGRVLALDRVCPQPAEEASGAGEGGEAAAPSVAGPAVRTPPATAPVGAACRIAP